MSDDNSMHNYVVFHPGTGTFVSADESVLINIDDLPVEFDEWEEYLKNFARPSTPAWQLAKGDDA